MALVLAFGVVLLISISLSGVAARTVLSTTLLFLLAGAVIGPGGFGVDDIRVGDPVIVAVADVALFIVLFTDGQRARLSALRENWRLSGRALGLGMPLTMVGLAVIAHLLAGLDWPQAFLLGAILSPTDPVFASALVGRNEVPVRLRRLLNVESGLNDGLALPLVMIFLAMAQHHESDLGGLALELVGGVVIGSLCAAAVAIAWRSEVLTAEPRMQPLGPLAIAIIVYGGCHLTHANPYLAAFAAGSTLATLDPVASDHFQAFGDLVSEATKFAALLIFGALITPDRLLASEPADWAFAIAAILVVRPAAIGLSLVKSTLPVRQRLAAAWFGPKGFASVVYGLFVIQSGLADASEILDLVLITIVVSIVAHSSTDVPAARLFRTGAPTALPSGRDGPSANDGEAGAGKADDAATSAARGGAT